MEEEGDHRARRLEARSCEERTKELGIISLQRRNTGLLHLSKLLSWDEAAGK